MFEISVLNPNEFQLIMADLSTTYMGLKLKNPIIAGSSGLTKSIDNIKELAANGAGAIVLKSLFEEQIKAEASKAFTESDPVTGYGYAEAQDYVVNYTKHHDLEEYLQLIRDAKAAVDIPIIASINCVSSNEWIKFAKNIQEAGADALELNVYILPSDPRRSGEDNQRVYFDIIEKVKKQIDIPIALKISPYFSGLAKIALKLSWTGISSLVMFNRFYSPDIDIHNFKITSTNVFSNPEEISTSLRWVAMLSDKLHCDISASTGVHTAEGAIKQLLAGATTVQLCSTLYRHGLGRIKEVLADMETWMQEHEFEKVDDFRGKLSYKRAENPAAYERVQFMKHFAGIE